MTSVLVSKPMEPGHTRCWRGDVQVLASRSDILQIDMARLENNFVEFHQPFPIPHLPHEREQFQMVYIHTLSHGPMNL